jgi:hypothetical protein
MSKSNMLLGLAKGKVGDLVFYRDGGEQRTRTRVVPKNPRTFAQQAQRVKIANVGGIFRSAADILRDSFVNRPSNQSGYNAFASRAIANAPYLTKEMATAGAIIPQPAMASKGTLPAVPFGVISSADFAGPYVNLKLATTEATTIGEVASALLIQAPWLTPLAELHFFTLGFTANQDANTQVDVYAVSLLERVLKIDPSSTELLSSVGLEVVNDHLQPDISVVGDESAIFMSVVLQSLVDGDGALDVSTQHFALSDSAKDLYEGYRTDAALQQAVDSYNASGEISLR